MDPMKPTILPYLFSSNPSPNILFCRELFVFEVFVFSQPFTEKKTFRKPFCRLKRFLDLFIIYPILWAKMPRVVSPFTSRFMAISPMLAAPVLPLEDGPDTEVDGPVKVESDGLSAGVDTPVN